MITFRDGKCSFDLPQRSVFESRRRNERMSESSIYSLQDVRVVEKDNQVFISFVDFLSFFLQVKRRSIASLFQAWKQKNSALFEPHLQSVHFPGCKGPKQLSFTLENVAELAKSVAQMRRITKSDDWATSDGLSFDFEGKARAVIDHYHNQDVSDKENKSSSSSSSAKPPKPNRRSIKAPRLLSAIISPHDNKPLQPLASPDSDLYNRLLPLTNPNQAKSFASSSSLSASNNVVDVSFPPLRRSPRKRASLGRSPLHSSSALSALAMYVSDDDGDLTDTE